MPAPISIDSDLGDLLEKEAREEALEIIRDPSERVDVQGVAMFKSNSQGSAFGIERAKALSALNLTLPHQLANASSEECEAQEASEEMEEVEELRRAEESKEEVSAIS